MKIDFDEIEEQTGQGAKRTSKLNLEISPAEIESLECMIDSDLAWKLREFLEKKIK
jgi:hypothetical protein